MSEYYCPICAAFWTLWEPPTDAQLAMIGEHMLRHHPRHLEPREHELRRVEPLGDRDDSQS